MTELRRESLAGLAPLRASLAAAARRESREIASNATRSAAEVVAAASSRAAELRADADARGKSSARAESASAAARARRDAHELVLAAQSRLASAWASRVATEATALRDDPRYGAMLDALRARAVAVLGEGAQLAESPDAGITAVQGSRRLDLSLPTLAATALADIQHEGGQPW